MEEEKIADPPQPQKSNELPETVLWQWQSGPDPDPWAEKDPAKRTWQNYSDDDCLIIEEAFLLKKEIVDLKDYEVDLKKMVQVNKKFRNRIRRVRRQENNRFMMEMSEPIAVVRDEKTMNQAFGTIQHFLEYIMKRTPEAYGLYQRLKTLKLDSQINEFEDIMKEVIVCIEKGAETREKVIKTRDGSQATNFLRDASKIVGVIKRNSTILGYFLKAVLKVYTMDTFLCSWLNKLLRSEDWEEINVLTPYLVCLVYTFKLSEFRIQYQEPQILKNAFHRFFGNQRLFLYRGTALSKEHLELYNLKRIKYFSWNGVTSTSRDKKIAFDFIRLSLEKAKKLNEQKVKVLFKIETDFASSEDCEGMIDLFQNSCTQYPDEQEVILAPGTVFKLLKTRLVKNDIYEIDLRVTKKFEETKDNKALLGILQDKAILKDKAIAEGLPSQQSFRLLEMLKGNKLIRKLEITNSGIEEHIMEEIENLRKTTNLKKEDIKLINNTIVVSSLGVLAHYFSDENLNEIFKDNKIRFKEGGGVLKSIDQEIKALILSGEVLYKFKQNNQLKKLSETIKESGKMANLDLSNQKIDVSNDEFIDFLQCIKELKSLQSLSFKLKDDSLSKESLERLCQTVGSSNTLNRLHLEFNLSDEALGSLEEAFMPIVSVQSLSLNLKFSKKISSERLNQLKDGLISLKSLHHLSLNFRKFNSISDEVMTSFPFSPSLLSLSLNFKDCIKISDEGLGDLKSGLMSLTSLQLLSLNFSGCHQISDEGLSSLKDALISLTSLQHLDLSLVGCKEISNEGLNHLKKGLSSFTSLHHLSLNFRNCHISNEGLHRLKSALISLRSLRHLSLDFSWCNKIANRGLESLKDGLLPLKSLKNLSLHFELCKKISDEGLKHLQSSLISLTSLQHLTLNFTFCRKISSAGLNHLKSLMSLVSLQSLSLAFYGCENISDQGLKQFRNHPKCTTYISCRV